MAQYYGSYPQTDEQAKNRLMRIVGHKNPIRLRYVTDNIDVYIQCRTEQVNTPLNTYPKKILMLIVVAVANVLDVQIIGGGAALRNITIIFYAANEVISLLENTGALGVPYPKKMLDVLEQLKNREK